jgi:hypothetical protein
MIIQVKSSSSSSSNYYEFDDDQQQQQEEEDPEEQKRVHDILVEDWYDLVRYLVGLGFCIFGLIGLYFHQFAAYYFLKRYTNPNGTEQRLGKVISCEPIKRLASPVLPNDENNNNSSSISIDKDDDASTWYGDECSINYRMFVVYTASASTKKGICNPCGAPDPNSCVSPETLVDGEIEYFQWFLTSKPMPVDAEVSLILLKDNPKSACTPEVLNSHLMQAFSHKNCRTISLMGVSLLLGVIVLLLASVFEILSMPHPEKQRPIGWSILIIFFFLCVITGYIFCKMLFDHFKEKVFLSAIPVPAVSKRDPSDVSVQLAPVLTNGKGDQDPDTALMYQMIDPEEGQLIPLDKQPKQQQDPLTYR